MSLFPIARLTLAAVASAATAAPAIAQEAYTPYGAGPAYSTGYTPYGAPYYEPPAPYRDPGVVLDDITVYAPREIVGRSPTTGAPIERVNVSRVVVIRDLDLRTEWGVDELMRRVRDAADSACREIDRTHPDAIDDGRSCYRDAMERSMPQVDAAISGANRYAYVGE